MSKKLDYPAMVDEAMRSVVRDSLKQVIENGLQDNHHFYISFNTRYQGVGISPQLLAKYPQEITIVVQHQFWDLEVYKHSFSITLSFNNIPEKLVVPFDALTAFADPSVRFGLQFQQKMAVGGNAPKPDKNNSDDELEQISDESDEQENLENVSKVISLDAFRKNS